MKIKEATKVKSKYLIYEDYYVSVFNDWNKCMVVFVSDEGMCKAISYDSNFYSPEEDILAYVELINHSFRGIQSEEKDFYINKFIKHVERELAKGNEELNWEYLEHCGIKREA